MRPVWILLAFLFISAFAPASPAAAKHPKPARVRKIAPPRIHRSATARTSFRRSHPCPATGRATGACPGYVIDHIRPLACGGPDAPANMQWQTTAEAKAKDKWERAGCR